MFFRGFAKFFTVGQLISANHRREKAIRSAAAAKTKKHHTTAGEGEWVSPLGSADPDLTACPPLPLALSYGEGGELIFKAQKSARNDQ